MGIFFHHGYANVRISRYFGLVFASVYVVGYIWTIKTAACLLKTEAFLDILSCTDADA